jgi:ganglioside GM2 activator
MKIFLAFLLFIFNCQIDCKYNANKLLSKYNSIDEENIKFNYKNCGPSSDPLIFKSLSLSPDPIHFPGDVIVSADVSLKTNLSSPIQVSLKVAKVVGPSKITIPCISNVGSCTYSDICTMLPQNPSECPEFFIKNQLPCSCPFASVSLFNRIN